jgi:hypothetical protein
MKNKSPLSWDYLTMATSSILRNMSPDDHEQIDRFAEVMEAEIPSLAPTDHGKDAFLVLAGCTLIQAPVWGKPNSTTYISHFHLIMSKDTLSPLVCFKNTVLLTMISMALQAPLQPLGRPSLVQYIL